jgi:uncharacterized membrane protein HdeD (DUF308 family)
MTSISSTDPGHPATALPIRWKWVFALVVLCIALGIAGLFMTMTLMVAGVFWYGILLAIAGVAQVAEAAFNRPNLDRRWSRALRLALGVAYAAAGLVMILNPVRASLLLTLVIGVMLVASGVARAIWSFFTTSGHSHTSTILAGVVSAILGVLIIAQWPLSGLWVIGLFVACDLIAYGISWCLVAWRAR